MIKHKTKIYDKVKKIISDYDNLLVIGFTHDKGNYLFSDFHGGICDDCLRRALKAIHKEFKIKLRKLVKQQDGETL